ncbi:MAG: DUF2062 domain-containing protein [Burkholderiales bacterium]
MPRKYFRKYLPSHESIKSNRFIGYFGPALKHHNLWHLNRHSVAGGVAVGMFTGLIPGPLQVISSVVLTMVFRVNLPVAILTTFYTNPLTIVPLYIVAYQYGKLVTGITHNGSIPVTALANPFNTSISQWIPALVDWMQAAGKPFLIGLVLLAISLSLVGYLVVQGLWRAYIVLQWRRRLLRRARAAAG